jgi:peptide/nickel transport system substrate-binding protein
MKCEKRSSTSRCGDLSLDRPRVDRAKREAVLRRLQQLVHERAIVAPIYELAFVNGVGRRVEEAGFGLIAGYAFSAP